MKPLRRLLADLSLRDLLAIAVPAAVVVIAAFWLAARTIQPAPPAQVTLSSGAEGGAYDYFVSRYASGLKAFGMTLVNRPSAGSAENLARLRDAGSGVDAALIQGGTSLRDDGETLMSLGSVFYEPLWVFYRGARGLDRLDQLAGKRLAIGAPGSGTRALANELLAAHGLTTGTTDLRPLGGLAAVAALAAGEVDAVFVVGAPQSASVWLLLHAEDTALLDFSQAAAYARRLPYLTEVSLPAGVINLQRAIPPTDIRLVAPVATLVARQDLHPAVVDALLQTMSETHRDAGLFQRPGQFPNALAVDLPLSERAERYYRSGPPFLQRYLPFAAANFLDRIVVLLLPLVAVLIPLLRILPALYSWRVRSRIYRWYGELKFLEMEARRDLAARPQAAWLNALDELEASVNAVRAPLAYTDFVYTLRMHISLVRDDILRRHPPGPGHPAPAERTAEQTAG